MKQPYKYSKVKVYFSNLIYCLILILTGAMLWLKESLMIFFSGIMNCEWLMIEALSDLEEFGNKCTDILNEGYQRHKRESSDENIKVLSDDEADDWVE